ncbi:MAG: UPF0147 family protein [Candidatus Nanoarchaeia archaeon]|nr:UPF0147 family protein [Candidatus Nanoarchaeia archaeon]MDD5054085.1 UPF0147 family protein [Candidatus Nanoarchaeia archaeon]
MGSENIESSIGLLDEIIDDSSVPKNIKQTCEKVKSILIGSGDEKVRIDDAVQNLDLLADNASVPTYTRMQIWNIVSLLESSQNI